MHKNLIITLTYKLLETHSVIRLLFEPFIKQLIRLKLSDFFYLLWIGSLFQSLEIVIHLLVMWAVIDIDLTPELHEALQMFWFVVRFEHLDEDKCSSCWFELLWDRRIDDLFQFFQVEDQVHKQSCISFSVFEGSKNVCSKNETF